MGIGKVAVVVLDLVEEAGEGADCEILRQVLCHRQIEMRHRTAVIIRVRVLGIDVAQQGLDFSGKLARCR